MEFKIYIPAISLMYPHPMQGQGMDTPDNGIKEIL